MNRDCQDIVILTKDTLNCYLHSTIVAVYSASMVMEYRASNVTCLL